MAKHLILVLFLTFVIVNLVNCDFFPAPQFSGEDVTQKMFGDSGATSDVFPIAYGDFNADKLTDIIAVPSNRSAIYLFLAHEEAPFLRLKKKCVVQTENNTHKLEIIGAAPGDFTGDGLMDLLVTMRHEGLKNLEVVIFEGNSSDLICSNLMNDTLLMALEPLVVDLNGDMIMDLVSEVYFNDDYLNRDTQKSIWIFKDTPKLNPSRYDFQVTPKVYPEQKSWEKRPMTPLNAFVDVDEDQIPELVLITTESKNNNKLFYIHTYKIIMASQDMNIRFNYTNTPLLIKSNLQQQMNTLGQPLFVDFNQDGRLMQLIPYCSQVDCKNSEGILPGAQGIKVVYNRTVTDLELASVSFENIDWGFARPYSSDAEFIQKERYYSRSIVLRVGDYNLDGYPDIIAVLEASGRGRADVLIKRAVIFENVPCKPAEKKPCPFPRTFSPNFKVLSQYTNVTLATFFDIHEDGLIDVLIVQRTNSTTKSGSGGRFEVRAFQNSPDYDSNFIKVMVLTGRKCPKCPQLGIPYGNLLTGPMISYKTKTQEGDLQTAVAVQNYRSTNMPMDLPYTIFGIGHSPNFVETLKIDISSHSHEWPQIIPNSQIIVIPHPIDEPKQWKAKLFLTPSDAVWQTFAVLVAICLVVTCIVVGLQIKEDCKQTPGVQLRPPILTISPSKFDVSQRVHIPNTGNVSSDNVMKDDNKQHIFDLMRDHTLRPHGHDTTLFHNYVTKAAWSPVPLYRGQHVESRCILGVLTSSHQFLIYRQRNQNFTTEIWTEPWEVILDVTNVYNEYLCSVWDGDEDGTCRTAPFDTYKKRLYEIAITDFLWIPDWNPNKKYTDSVEGVFISYLMTFHASGDVCILKVVVSKTVIPKYSITVVYRKQRLVEVDDIVSTTAYSYISQDFGVLLVGTNKGKLLSYIVEKYIVGKEHCLWEEDMIRVEHIMMCPTSSSSSRKKLDIIAVKNPNILIATTASITSLRVTGNENEFSALRVPHGPIVGIKLKKDKELIVAHESGLLSLVSLKDGELKCLENSCMSIFDPQKTLKKKAILIGEAVQKLEKKERNLKQIKDSDKRLIFQGLGLSPNKTLLCVSRTVGVYFDHLQIRKPTQLVFYSLLPVEKPFDTVQSLYAENGFSMRAIVDVLVPFRFALRSKFSSLIFKDIYSWAIPLETKTVEELQLLLWCLRVCPKPDPTELEVANAEKMFNPDAIKKFVEIETLRKYRIEVVTDRILQRRCESLLRAVLQNQEREEFSLNIEINKQCLQAMFQFLNSKDNRRDTLPKIPEFNPAANIPICYWCKGPLEFPLELEIHNLNEIDEELKTELDKEEWFGFKWNIRRHPVKEFGSHKPEICILTLLPIQFPYRRCTNCFVAASIEPAFGQLPYCPLCNTMMYPNQVILNMPDIITKTDPDESVMDIENETESADDWLAQSLAPQFVSDSDGNESDYISDDVASDN